MIRSFQLGAGLALCMLFSSVASAEPGPATKPASATQSDDSPEAVAAHVLELVRTRQGDDMLAHMHAEQVLDAMGPDATPAVDALIKLLDDPNLHADAALELGRIGNGAQKAVAPLIHRAKAGNGQWNSWAIEGLGGIGIDADRCVPLFIEALKSSDDSTQMAAARALVEFGTDAKPALPALIEALHSADGELRILCCEAIAEQGHEAVQALPVLQKMVKGLNDKSRETESIAQALAAMGTPGLPTLLEMLNSKDEQVRGPVYENLAKLKGDAAPAVPRLIDRLKEKDERSAAINTLRSIGPNAKAAIPALMAIAKDSNDKSNESAAHALVAIAPVEAQNAGIKEPDTIYLACVNQDPQYYRSQTLGIISSGDPMDCLVMWVNGDPVEFYTGGGSMMSLNRYLKPGKNELTFSQPHTLPVFVDVFRTIADDIKPIGVHAFRGPGSANLAPPLEFDINKLSSITVPESLGDISHESVQQEVREQLDELIKLINAHDGKRAADLLCAGERALTSADYRKSIDEEAGELAKAISDPSVSASLTGKPIQLLIGKKLIKTYVQLPEAQKEPAPIIQFKKGGKSGGLASISFARLHGKLIVWEVPRNLSFTLSSDK